MGKNSKLHKEKEKKEIELIEQQKRDNKTLELSSFEVLCLFIISVFTNSLLLSLFASPIFPTKIFVNYQIIGLSFMTSVSLVTLSYRSLATKLINYHMRTRFSSEISIFPIIIFSILRNIKFTFTLFVYLTMFNFREPKEGLSTQLGKSYDECYHTFKDGIHKESFYFSIFAVNTFLLVIFLAIAAYFIRPYTKGNSQIYAGSSIISSAVTVLLSQVLNY